MKPKAKPPRFSTRIIMSSSCNEVQALNLKTHKVDTLALPNIRDNRTGKLTHESKKEAWHLSHILCEMHDIRYPKAKPEVVAERMSRPSTPRKTGSAPLTQHRGAQHHAGT